MEQDAAPGWDAIDAALAPLVGETEPQHWGTDTALPDQDGLWGISAYPLDDHWLFVTYGLSELFTKVSDVVEISGWGHELTLRCLRQPQDDVPPSWIVSLLSRLGEVTYEQNQPFAVGGRMDLPNAPEGYPAGLVWTEDPLLAGFDGPFGRVDFLAVVGVSDDLMTEARLTTTALMLTAVSEENPAFVTGVAPLP